MNQTWRSTLAAALLACCLGCGDASPPPDDARLFAVSLDGFEDQVVRQIDERQQAVRDATPAQRVAALGTLATTYHAYELPIATEVYDVLMTLEPQNPRWPYARGRAFTDQGELDAARQALEISTTRFGANISDTQRLAVHLALAENALATGDLDRATNRVEEARALEPEHPAVLFFQGRLALENDRLDDARAILERVLELDPRADATHHHLARIARRQNRADDVTHHTERAGSTPPRIDDPWLESVAASRIGTQSLLQSAQEALLAGRIEEARATYRAVLHVNPDTVDAWINLGGIDSQLGRRDDARAAFERVLAIEPANARAHFNLGVLALQEARWADARTAFDTTLEIDPRFVDARLNLALALHGQGEVKRARATLREVAEARPDAAMAFLWLGIWALDAAEYDHALEWFERGQRNQADSRLDHALARFLAVCPRADLRDGLRAATLLPAAENAGVPPWQLARTRAMIAAELGNFADAIKAQRDALRRAPRRQDLREALDRELEGYSEGRPVRLPTWNPLGV
ncbi:MAG: tetratricopeptide repeat protein [Acidobacteriota bacterium]